MIHQKLHVQVSIDAVETPETFDLADLLPMGRGHYALQVCGTSMIEEGIHDGDLVIVERRTSADDGETVVAIVDDEVATLKKLDSCSLLAFKRDKG